MKRISFALLATLVALIIGAWEVVLWEWNHASVGLQIRAVAIAITVGMILAIWAFYPAFKLLI